jgi:hypothetical protein
VKTESVRVNEERTAEQLTYVEDSNEQRRREENVGDVVMRVYYREGQQRHAASTVSAALESTGTRLTRARRDSETKQAAYIGVVNRWRSR